MPPKSLLMIQRTRATITTTMRMPVQTPALNIPSITEQLVIRKKEDDIIMYVNCLFIIKIFVCINRDN